MIDTETHLRRGLAALADGVNPPVPPLPTLDRRDVSQRRARRAVVAAVLVLGVALAGGIAAAAGIVPEPVADVFEEITGWDSSTGVRPEDARVVATFSLDGTTYEYWVSESADGDRCEYMRFVRDGEPENGWKRCDQRVEEHHNDALNISGGTGVPEGQLEFSGRAPGDASVVVVAFVDGTSVSVPVQDDGYFVFATNDPAIVDQPDFPVAAIEARSNSGGLIARRDY